MAIVRTVSVVKGKGNVNHNNREFVTENVIEERIEDNITYKKESLEDAYEHLFGDAIREYNERQKRNDRKIDGASGYILKLKNSKNGEKIFYETVVQIGNMQDCSVDSPEGKEAKKILDDYMKTFQERNPNLYVFNAVMHLDEKTPHLHIDYIPIAHNYKQGLKVRNSLDKALGEQIGEFEIDKHSSKLRNRTIRWQESEKKCIATIMKEHGFEKSEDKGLHLDHLSIAQFKATAEIVKQEIKNYPQTIEASPVPFSKEKVVVKKSELEKLEERATLSMIHEKASKEAYESIDSKLKMANTRYDVALTYYDSAEKQMLSASASEKDAKALKEKYQKLYAQQEELNQKYKQLYAFSKKELHLSEELVKENDELKAKIDDLSHDFEKKVLNIQKPLKDQIEGLETKLNNMAKFQYTVVRALKYIRDMFCGPVGKAFLNATINSLNNNFTKNGFDEYTKLESSKAMPLSINKELELDLDFKKGSEGLGLYTNKDVFIGACKNLKEAKELYPKCKISSHLERELER